MGGFFFYNLLTFSVQAGLFSCKGLCSFSPFLSASVSLHLFLRWPLKGCL